MANRTRMTAQHVDKQMAFKRYEEGKMSDLLSYNSGNVRQGVVNERENRVDLTRRQNDHAKYAAEKMFEDRIRESEKVAKRQYRDAEQDERLARELARRRMEDLRQEREIQRICEESEELRNLEAKLKLAYMNKERASQHEERAMLEEMERARDAAIDDQMEYDRKQAMYAERDQEEMRRHYQVEAKLQLQEQILFRQQQMEEARKEAEMDKVKVDAIVQRIELEDRDEIHAKASKVHQTRESIRAYQTQREAELAARRRMEEEEERRILSYQEQQRTREANIQQQEDRRKAEEEARFEAIKAEVERKAREEEELARLRDELWEEETEAKLQEKESAAAIRRARMRREMVEANAAQRVMKAAMREQLLREELALKEKMMEKFRRDQALDREAEARRRSERIRYVTSIDNDLERKRLLVEDEKAREMSELRRQEEEEAFKARVVEEARRRLLETHAAALQGFLPKGVLARREDLDVVLAPDRGDQQYDEGDQLQQMQEESRRNNYSSSGRQLSAGEVNTARGRFIDPAGQRRGSGQQGQVVMSRQRSRGGSGSAGGGGGGGLW